MEEDKYLLECEFIISSFMPKKLEVGMSFITRTVALVPEPEISIITLEELPDSPEEFMKIHGAPVTINIISCGDKGEIVALYNEIGYFSDNEIIHPITNSQINTIINQYGGRMNLDCDETGDVILYDGKVIISYLELEEEDDDSNS